MALAIGCSVRGRENKVGRFKCYYDQMLHSNNLLRHETSWNVVNSSFLHTLRALRCRPLYKTSVQRTASCSMNSSRKRTRNLQRFQQQVILVNSSIEEEICQELPGGCLMIVMNSLMRSEAENDLVSNGATELAENKIIQRTWTRVWAQLEKSGIHVRVLVRLKCNFVDSIIYFSELADLVMAAVQNYIKICRFGVTVTDVDASWPFFMLSIIYNDIQALSTPRC